MEKKIAVIAIAIMLVGCVGKKSVAEKTVINRCEAIASSDEWFKELMKTAAKEGMASTDDTTCPCYKTITCEGETYCDAHKCSDGQIKDPWKIEP